MGAQDSDHARSLVDPSSPERTYSATSRLVGTLSSVSAPVEPVGHLDELCSQASEAIGRAAQLLRQGAISIRYRDTPGVHWYLFLDDPSPNLIETCAISTAMLTINTADDHQDRALINLATDILLALQNESGGWTSWVNTGNLSAQPEASLVIDTFFAIRALDLVDPRSEAVARGRNWLCEIQDPASGGWGFYEGGAASILPTAMALRVLGAAAPADRTPQFRQAIDRGLQWLFRAQDESPSHAWGRTIGDSPSAVHTAMVLMAFRACGVAVHNFRIERARTWLLEHRDDRARVIDVYNTPGLDVHGATIPSRRIQHVSFPEGIILQGLLASGCALVDPRLLGLVQELVKNQAVLGHWPCLSVAFESPVFAIMDATLALRAFLEEVNSDSARLEILESLRTLTMEVGTLRASCIVMAESIESLKSELTLLRRATAVLKPIIFVRNMPTYWKIAILLLAVAAGAGIATAEASGPTTAIISGATAFVAITITLVTFVVQERHATSETRKRSQ